MSEFQKAAERLMELVPDELPVDPIDERREQGRRVEFLRKAGVPKRVLTVLERGIRPNTATAAVETFGGGILVLSGQPGCGKTVAAAHWLMQTIPTYSGDSVARGFVTAFQLERVSRYDNDAMRELERTRRLAIDDLGTEYLDKNGHFVSFLDGLINVRYSEERDTVIATNLDANEFKQSYGARIADRIRECGRFVSINEPSLRRKPKERA